MFIRIYIEAEDGGEGFSGYADTANRGGERVLLSDDENLWELVKKLKKIADHNDIAMIEIPVDLIPD